jgi:hypothetical protein
MSAALLGSCTDAPTGAMLVCEEKLFTVVVPSRLTSAVKAKPSVVTLVSGDRQYQQYFWHRGVPLSSSIHYFIVNLDLGFGNSCATVRTDKGRKSLKIWRGRRDSNSRPLP